MSALQMLMGFYVGTVVVNILVTAIQYFSDRAPAQKALLIYWLGILASALINGVVTQPGFLMVLIPCTGTFISQFFLAAFFGELRGIKLSFRPFAYFMASTLVVAALMDSAGLRFEAYAFITVLGGVAPLFVCAYLALKRKSRPFTVVQKMFLSAALLMNFHYLDWPFTRPHADWLMIGMAISFGFLYLVSVLAAMAANEHVLQVKNESLGVEVEKRARQVTDAERQLWEANKLASIGRMAGGVAHEINTPLATISLQLESLQTKAREHTLSSAEVEREATGAMQLIERIARITGALRKVARDNTNSDRLAASFGEIIERTLACCADHMRELSIHLEVSLPERPCLINCNASEISQVILNLLNNAIDAVEMCENREIKVRLDETAQAYRLAVEDSGYLDPAIAPRLMEPFFTTKAVGKGTGLGLSVSRSIAESHGGSLYLDTTTSRTRFVLELPKKVR